MSIYSAPIDIANRALQRVGGDQIADGGFGPIPPGEDSKSNFQVTKCYDKLRTAELQRNCWVFATKRAVLRPISTTTMLLVPAPFDATKTYILASIVSYNGIVYFSKGATPAATTPDINPSFWSQYFGPLTVSLWDSTLNTGYYSGELVYTPGTPSYKVYLSLTSGNSDTPGTTPAWDATITYKAGATVTGSNTTIYQSKIDLNVNINPVGDAGVHWVVIPGTQPDQMTGQNWLQLDATIKSITIIYPVGSGPSEQSFTRNVFRLPNGYLREAPQEPKQGSNSVFGAPTNRWYDDWVKEGKFITSEVSTAITIRFVADVADVTDMSPMFCEGLAMRIALEVCEPLTQSDAKIQGIGAEYKAFMTEARMNNAIESGADEPPMDDYIACRV